MLKIGITGGIGSGKSTVCDIFSVLGIPIYDADSRAKKIMTGSKQVKQEILHLFGSNAYYRNGRLNRKHIASQAFKDKELLSKLNKIVHPAVGVDFEEWAARHANHAYVIKEAALLIESKSYLTLDKLILVTANEEIRTQRVLKRDKTTKEEVKRRINNQMSDKERKEFADYFIDNSGEKSLINQVISIDKKLRKLSNNN